MIARLRGELLERGLEEIVVEAGGVGFGLLVSLNTLGALGPVGARVDLYVHTVVREDALTLYGFATALEREAFRKLTGVSGVGPKLARSLLSAMSPEELGRALRSGDVRLLSRAPGVGKRTAERLVVELKESFPYPTPGAGPATPAGTTPGGADAPAPHGQRAADLEQALSFMGYKGPQIDRVVGQLTEQLDRRPLEELIRDALALLQGRPR